MTLGPNRPALERSPEKFPVDGTSPMWGAGHRLGLDGGSEIRRS